MVTSSDAAKRTKKVVEEDPGSPEHVTKLINPAEQLVNAMAAYEDATLELTGGKLLLKMVSDNYSVLTESGVKFTKKHPFQLVDKGEADLLIENGGFRKATSQEVIEFYMNTK